MSDISNALNTTVVQDPWGNMDFDPEKITITPEMAAYLLSHKFDKQRAIHAATVSRKKQEMEVWQFYKGSPIILALLLDENRNILHHEWLLLDGQHRLAALIEANISWPFTIVRYKGTTMELAHLYNCMDTSNKKRDAIDIVRPYNLGKAVDDSEEKKPIFDRKYATAYVSAVKHLHLFKDCPNSSKLSSQDLGVIRRYTAQMWVAFEDQAVEYKKLVLEQIPDYKDSGWNVMLHKAIMGPSLLALRECPIKARSFVLGVANTGKECKRKSDARLVLRNHFNGVVGKGNRNDTVYARLLSRTVTCWNKWVENESIQKIPQVTNELPAMYGIDDYSLLGQIAVADLC